MQKIRCSWVKGEVLEKYHDSEWGRRVKNENLLFEMLCLEGAQAGLSFETVLKKRAEYRKVFLDFDPLKVSKIKNTQIDKMMKNIGLIKHKGKLDSVISNAKNFLLIQKEFGSFDGYLKKISGGKIIVNKIKNIKDIPTSNSVSDIISKDLKKRGFKFVGPTIIYAYLQAIGLVVDHEQKCFLAKN